MENKASDSSQKSSPSKKAIKEGILIAVITLLVGTFFFFLYEWFLQPFVALAFFKPVTYQGIELYTREEYLEFEGGENFKDAVADINTIANYEIKEFYYSDNSYLDNLIRGELYDFYALEYDVGADYELLKEWAAAEGKYCGGLHASENSYLYEMARDLEVQSRTLIVFKDSDQSVRLMYVHDVSGDNIVDGTDLSQHGHFSWIYD